MLKTRILTAIALLPVVLGMLFLAGPAAWALFAAAIAIVSGWEWSRMCGFGPRARNAYLLERMDHLEGEARAAYYEAVVVLLCPDGREEVFTGRVSGFIRGVPDGGGGFGYDPLFFHPGLGRTFGNATSTEKDHLSHRGKAIRAMRAFLEEEGLP